MAESVYHLELRQFPHNMCRFNVSAVELRATVLEAWVQDRWVELGERKWNPQQATLTVLEGPRIAAGQLTMGRGWRTAQRQGRDVTAKLLEGVRQAGEVVLGPAADAVDPLADSLGLELLARLGSELAPLRRAWELAGERHPGAPASASLALAEGAVRSLLRARLIVLLDAASDANAGAARPVDESQAEPVLGAIESWTGAEADAGVWMRRV